MKETSEIVAIHDYCAVIEHENEDLDNVEHDFAGSAGGDDQAQAFFVAADGGRLALVFWSLEIYLCDVVFGGELEGLGVYGGDLGIECCVSFYGCICL